MSPEGDSESPDAFRPDETIVQPEEAQASSRELSIPAGVEQSPEAPVLAGYILTRPLGRGAFADVWRAWQTRTRKPVAVKVFRRREGVNWLYLQREVERLIRLDKHPHIVSLLDADLTGEPSFYTMDLLGGGSLEDCVGEKAAPSAADVARWMGEICEALGYVHSKGLIHCDLKPANVLLDEEGRTRVADFGQSRILTDSAGSLGTLFYMAPEQALLGEAVTAHPDVRWDIYALGAIAYALMTGKVPYSSERAALEAAGSLPERLEVYRGITRNTPLDWGSAAAADEDLVAIAAKCANPDPGARYESVAGVKADLEARLRRLPVSPLAGNRGYRARRFVQRNLALVALGAAAAVSLLAAGVQVVQARADAMRRLAFSYSMRGRQFSEKGDPASAAAYYAESYRLHPSNLARAAALSHLDELSLPEFVLPHKWGIRDVLMSPDGTRVLTTSWEDGASLWNLKEHDARRGILAHGGRVDALAFSPDGALAATGGKDGRLVLWNSETGAAVRGWKAHSGGVTSTGFSPDGNHLVTGGPDGGVRRWRTADGSPTGIEHRCGSAVASVGYDSGGGRLVAVESDNTLTIWELEGTEAVWRVKAPGGVPVVAAGAQVAAGIFPDGIHVFDASTLPVRGRLVPGSGAVVAALSPDGGRLLAGFDDGSLRLFGAADGRPLADWTIPGPVGDLAFAPGGIEAVVSGKDGVVRFLQPGADRAPRRPLRHSSEVSGFSLNLKGTRMVTAAGDGLVRVWSVPVPLASAPQQADAALSRAAGDLPPGAGLLRQEGPLIFMEFSRDGSSLLTIGADGAVRVWEGAGEAPQTLDIPMPEGIARAALSPDGKSLAAESGDGAIVLWDLETGKSRGRTDPAGGVVSTLSFDTEGKWILAGHSDGGAHVWDISSMRQIGRPVSHQAPLSAGAFDPLGRFFATGAADGSVLLHLMEKGSVRTVARLAGHKDWIASLEFSPDGRHLLAASWDNTARLWDVPLCERQARGRSSWIARLKKTKAKSQSYGDSREEAGDGLAECEPSGFPLSHSGDLSGAVFGPGGRYIATASWDGTAVVWDAAAGTPVGSALRHPGGVSGLAFSPDGSSVLTCGWDGIARFWDPETGEPVSRPLRLGGPATRLVFSPDGRRAAVAVADGAVLLRTDGLSKPLSRQAIGIWARAASGRSVTESGDIDASEPETPAGLKAARSAREGF